MAKLKGPLFSLGASQQLGKTLVYFGWKGLDVVREYVIPSNPRTTGQTTQRGYMTDAVAFIHAHQGIAAHPLDSEDIQAYALLASVVKSATTWFNQLVKLMVDSRVLGHNNGSYGDGHLTPGAGTLSFETWAYFEDAPTAAKLHYGTSKTALINSIALTVAADKLSKTVPGLTTGVKYYAQVRPTAPAAAIPLRSGIYYGVPT